MTHSRHSRAFYMNLFRGLHEELTHDFVTLTENTNRFNVTIRFYFEKLKTYFHQYRLKVPLLWSSNK